MNDHELLVRIDERVHAVYESIKQINIERSCSGHEKRIATLEKLAIPISLALIGASIKILL